MVRIVAICAGGCALSAALAISAEIAPPRETCLQTSVQAHETRSIRERLAGILEVPRTEYDIEYETRCVHWDESG